MPQHLLKDRKNLLFVLLGGFFIANTITAEFIGVKIFSLEGSLGIPNLNWNIFGEEGSLQFTAGVILWPVVFVMTDLINEYYGTKGVRILSFLAVGLITYAFIMVFFAISLAPAPWWIENYQNQGIENMQTAFKGIFGQSLWIIIASLVAFLVGQITDVLVFHRIRKWTGEKYLGLRATGSTLVSQFIDSFVVLYIAFVIGPAKWDFSLFLAIGTVNYLYKFIIAILLTPVIWWVHILIDNYLGKEDAAFLKATAAAD